MKKTILLLAALITTAIGAMAQTDPLAGKRIGVIGDSYVKNHQNPVEYAWHSKLAKKHGMKYYNYGRNGSCVSIDMKTWGPAVVNRYQQMNDSLDVVVVIAGHNDAARLANAVTDSTTTLNNYREQCTKLCKDSSRNTLGPTSFGLRHGQTTTPTSRLSWMPPRIFAEAWAFRCSTPTKTAISLRVATSSGKSISKGESATMHT